MANYLILNSILALFYGSVLIISPLIWREALIFQLLTSLYLVPVSWFLGTIVLRHVGSNGYKNVFLGYPALVVLEGVTVYFLGVSRARFPLTVFSFLSIGYYVIINKNQWKGEKITKALKDQLPFLIVSLFAYLLFFLCYVSTLRPPTPEKPGLYYQDLLWTVGNLWSIIRSGFPVESSRFSGEYFGYHFVPLLHQAACFSLSGIEPFNLSSFFAPIFDLVMLCGGIYFGAIQFLDSSRRKAVLYCLILLFVSLPPVWEMDDYLAQIYFNPLSMFFSLQSFILIIFNIFRFSSLGTLNPFYCLILLAVSLGSKAHLVATLLPAIACFYLFTIYYSRAKPAKDHVVFILGLIGLVFLLKISLYKINSNQVFPRDFKNADSRIYNWFADKARLDGQAYLSLKYIFMSFKFFTLELFFNIIGNFYLLFTIISGFCWFQFKTRLVNLKPIVFVMSFLLFSLLVITLFSFPGGEVYFKLYPLITSLIFFIYLDFDNNYQLNRVKGALIGIGLILLLPLLYKLTLSNKWWIYPNLSKSVWDECSTISFYEREGLLWMKENLNGSIVASDRFEFCEYKKIPGLAGRFFGYSAFSGLRFYNEGYSFDGVIFPKTSLSRTNEISHLITLYGDPDFSHYMRAMSFDYFVVSKRFYQIPNDFVCKLDVVFENNDLAVVKNNKN
jgi:hypothetical protein